MIQNDVVGHEIGKKTVEQLRERKGDRYIHGERWREWRSEWDIYMCATASDHINWLAYGAYARDHCTLSKGQIPSFSIKYVITTFRPMLADLCAEDMNARLNDVGQLIPDADYFRRCRRSSSSSSSSFSSDLFIYLFI